MENDIVVQIKAQIKKRIQNGDYVTLSKMLDIQQNTARMRFVRNNEEVVLAMRMVINTREQLISNYQQLHNIN